jgi:hypothetical protein
MIHSTLVEDRMSSIETAWHSMKLDKQLSRNILYSFMHQYFRKSYP